MLGLLTRSALRHTVNKGARLLEVCRAAELIAVFGPSGLGGFRCKPGQLFQMEQRGLVCLVLVATRAQQRPREQCFSMDLAARASAAAG